MNRALRAVKNRRPDGTGFSFALSTKASSATLVAGMTSSPKCQSAGVPTWRFNYVQLQLIMFDLICSGKNKKTCCTWHSFPCLRSTVGDVQGIDHPQDFREVSASCGRVEDCEAVPFVRASAKRSHRYWRSCCQQQMWTILNTVCSSSNENHSLPIKKRARAGIAILSTLQISKGSSTSRVDVLGLQSLGAHSQSAQISSV